VDIEEYMMVDSIEGDFEHLVEAEYEKEMFHRLVEDLLGSDYYQLGMQICEDNPALKVKFESYFRGP